MEVTSIFGKNNRLAMYLFNLHGNHLELWISTLENPSKKTENNIKRVKESLDNHDGTYTVQQNSSLAQQHLEWHTALLRNKSLL